MRSSIYDMKPAPFDMSDILCCSIKNFKLNILNVWRKKGLLEQNQRSAEKYCYSQRSNSNVCDSKFSMCVFRAFHHPSEFTSVSTAVTQIVTRISKLTD